MNNDCEYCGGNFRQLVHKKRLAWEKSAYDRLTTAAEHGRGIRFSSDEVKAMYSYCQLCREVQNG